MDYKIILEIAEKYIKLLKPFCKRIEIAGSIRRKKEQCNDVEIVCIPDSYRLEQYFIENKRLFYFRKNGEKYKRLIYQGNAILDLFICNEKTWPMIYFIRTGSVQYVKKMMRYLNNKGYTSEAGVLIHVKSGKEIELKKEEDLFKYFNKKYLKPELRENN